MVQSGAYCSGVMSQNIWDAIFARELSDRAGGGCGRGVFPSQGRELFHFRLENVQSGAFLRRNIRLDDMYYIIITCMD